VRPATEFQTRDIAMHGGQVLQNLVVVIALDPIAHKTRGREKVDDIVAQVPNLERFDPAFVVMRADFFTKFCRNFFPMPCDHFLPFRFLPHAQHTKHLSRTGQQG
jgi:hypothetical protein